MGLLRAVPPVSTTTWLRPLRSSGSLRRARALAETCGTLRTQRPGALPGPASFRNFSSAPQGSAEGQRPRDAAASADSRSSASSGKQQPEVGGDASSQTVGETEPAPDQQASNLRGGSWFQRLKQQGKKYGIAFVIYGTVLWLGTLVGCYYFMISEVLPWQDIVKGLKRIPVLHPNIVDLDKAKPENGKLALAVVLNESLEIVRLPFVVLTIRPLVSLVSRMRR